MERVTLGSVTTTKRITTSHKLLIRPPYQPHAPIPNPISLSLYQQSTAPPHLCKYRPPVQKDMFHWVQSTHDRLQGPLVDIKCYVRVAQLNQKRGTGNSQPLSISMVLY